MVRSPETGTPSWLPESARVILLLAGAAEREWAASAALELAELIGRVRSRTLLANTVPGPSGPDHPLGCETVPGLAEALRGRRTVREVAVTPGHRPFIFLPAGRPTASLADLMATAAFDHLVRAAARGGTLLLYVSERDLGDLVRAGGGDRLGAVVDGCVALGELADPSAASMHAPLLARVEHSETETSPSGDRRSSGFSRPTRTPAIIAGRGSGRPPRRFERWLREVRRPGFLRGAGGVVAIWVTAIVAVWFVWQGLSGWPAFGEDAPPAQTVGPSEEAAADRAPDAAMEKPVPEDGPGAVGDGAAVPAVSGELGTSDDRVGTAASVELPYSVLVASYVTRQDAEQRRDALRDAGELAFVAPTVIRGRVYHRVFAGALEDRLQASDRMARLVAEGSKERERSWDMRPVRLAFALGGFGSEEAAVEERERLHAEGLPAYVLRGDDSDGASFLLYSGAFESEAAAAGLDSVLQAAGRPVPLVTRRGETR